MNFAFYISGSATRLLRFLKQAGEVSRQIKIVISDGFISEELKGILKLGKIRYIEIPYDTLEGSGNREKNRELSDIIMKQLDQYEIDYCFSFGTHILSGPLLEKYKFKLINFHPGLLPMFPGLRAIDQAIRQGNIFLVGNTAHFIDSGVDSGPVIMQSVIPLEAFHEQQEDYDCILDLQIGMLNEIIFLCMKNRLTVRDGKVKIIGADYQKSIQFPQIERE